jgi:iron complex transport system ATP-binding protein
MTAPVPSLIEMRNVSVMRGDHTVLHDITLTIQTGEHVAILGPNGCGKSTLIKTITRELYPLERDGASLKMLGRELWDVSELRSLLGIVSNDLMFMCSRPISARDAVLSGFFSSIGLWPHHKVTPAMRGRTDKLLAFLDIAHLADRRVSHMSSGEARRVLIARALVHDPRVLVFDEPSNSLDVFAQTEFRATMRKLAKSGIALLLVTHHLPDIIPEIDRVILMRAGRIVDDGPKTKLLTAKSLTALFGVRVNLGKRDGFYHLW